MVKILLAAVLLTLLSSCGMQDTPVPPVTDQATTPQTPSTKNYEETLETASSKIKWSEEFRSCMDMNVNMCIQNAGMQLAQKSKSAEFCKELTSPEQQESCIFAVTMVNAQEKKDKSLCDTLSDTYKRQCMMSMIRSEASEKKDITLCDQIEKSQSGSGTGIRDTGRDDCKMNIIMIDQSSQAGSCNTIDDVGLKAMCTTMIKNRNNNPSTTAPQR